MPATFTESFGRFARSPGFKFFLVLLLVLLLMIPLGLIWFLVSERESRAYTVKEEVAGQWGRAQHISGPYLIVPYTVKVMVPQPDNKLVETQQERRAVFLPDSLNINGDAKTEVRHRAIYDVTVYGAKLTLEGRFASPDINLADADVTSVRWRDAILAVGISDVSGLTEGATLTIEGGPGIPFEPSIGLANSTSVGIHARIAPSQAADQPTAAFTFRFNLALNGSTTLNFAPVARETRVTLASNWPHPSFAGAFLPESRDIRPDGFTASWRVPHLARSVPQVWSLGGPAAHYSLDRFSPYQFGTNFYVPIDYYDLVNRAAKYGLMFLAIAFMAVLVLELTSGKRVHAVQYVLVGLSMILFYALLLSFSEHIGFPLAYLMASVATGGMLSVYVGYALSSRVKGLIMLCVFLILYGLLYLILRLEDYALLAGAVAGFVMLTVTMFATLRVNWSGDDERAPAYGGRQQPAE